MNPFRSWAHAAPILLLCASNLFMTLAWYGHLRFRSAPLFLVIVVNWAIAFFEYCLAVPANRFGRSVYSAAELKTMQEVITLVVFALFSWLYLSELIQTGEKRPAGIAKFFSGQLSGSRLSSVRHFSDATRPAPDAGWKATSRRWTISRSNRFRPDSGSQNPTRSLRPPHPRS